MSNLILKPADKKELTKIALNAIKELSQKTSHSEIWAELARLKHVVKVIEENIKVEALDDIDEKTTLSGVEVEKQYRNNWDFNHDPDWADLAEKIDGLKAKQKRREKLMISAFNKMPDDLIEGGEVIPPATMKPATCYLKCKIL